MASNRRARMIWALSSRVSSLLTLSLRSFHCLCRGASDIVLSAAHSTHYHRFHMLSMTSLSNLILIIVARSIVAIRSLYRKFPAKHEAILSFPSVVHNLLRL